MTDLYKYPSMVSHMVYKPKAAKVEPRVEAKVEMATNTNPNNNIGIVNAGQLKKKPHNITIKNFNPNEPKTHQSRILYSDKQNYRRYKTKTEPKLYSKIMIDEEDDLVAKIRKEFGITAENKKTNYSEVNTSGATYTKDPEPHNYEISDISRDESEDIVGQLSTIDFGEVVENDEDDDNEITEENKPSNKKSKKKTIVSNETKRLIAEMKELGLPSIRGAPPKEPAAVEARNRYMAEKIAEHKANITEAKK